MEADFNPHHLSIRNLKRKMDIRNLVFVYGHPDMEHTRGRMYYLWKDDDYIVIHGEPYAAPGVDHNDLLSILSATKETRQAYWELLEVIQSMVDEIQFGRSNYAYLVRQKDGTHRLVYKPKRMVLNCPAWTRLVELKDIEITRLCWGHTLEGVWQGRDVDLMIGCNDTYGGAVSRESQGYRLMHALGLEKYVFEMLGHVTRNGVIIGLMTVPPTGRKAEPSDRFAVYQAISDLQSHGLLYYAVNIQSIFITDEGVKFINLNTLHHYRDQDELAKEAEDAHWVSLALMFGDPPKPEWEKRNGNGADWLLQSRTQPTNTFVIPPNMKPNYSISAPAQALVSWLWSATGVDPELGMFYPHHLKVKYSRSSGYVVTLVDPKARKKSSKAVLAPSDDDDDKESQSSKHQDLLDIDKPLTLPGVPRRPRGQHRPYDRPTHTQRLIIYRGDD